jgi:hypothetical protein
MSIESKTLLKSYFETGDIPTEANFISLIDTLNDDFVDVTTFDTYQLGIDYCADNDKVAYFKPMTHLLDTNLNITSAMHIYIAQGATVKMSDTAEWSYGTLSSTGSRYQCGVFHIGAADNILEGFVFTCYGIINANYDTLGVQTFLETGVQVQSRCTRAYVSNAKWLGKFEVTDTEGGCSFVNSENVFVDTIYSEYQNADPSTTEGPLLGTSGTSFLFARNLIAKNWWEGCDFNNGNRRCFVDTCYFENTSECLDINGSADIVVNNVFALNNTRLVNITPDSSGSGSPTIPNSSNIVVNNLSAAFTSAATKNMDATALIAVQGNRCKINKAVLTVNSTYSGTMCANAIIHYSGNQCEYDLIWNASNFATSKYQTASVFRMDIGEFCKVVVNSIAPIDAGNGIVIALASTHLDVTVSGEQPIGSTESNTRVGVSLATGTHTSPIIRFINVRRLTQLRTTGTVTGMKLLESISGASADVRFSGFANGQMVFDTTLNKPIFKLGATWIDASGTVV